MNTKSNSKGFGTAAAGIAMAIGSIVAIAAAPAILPGVRARLFDTSAQDVQNFLQQARTESVKRNAPVACRIEKTGYVTVLSLDWSLNGLKTHAEGERLVLPKGVAVLQAGEPVNSGTLVIFNPRGGVRLGPGTLELSWPGPNQSERRKIVMIADGTLKSTSTSNLTSAD